MSLETKLRAQAPVKLAAARAITHKAVQLLTTAARANLPAQPDDSHSNLGWDTAKSRFVSQPLPSARGDLVVALSILPLRLELFRTDAAVGAFAIDGRTYDEAAEWLDAQLSKSGLNAASQIEMPYELPDAVAAVVEFHAKSCVGQLATLSAWYALAAGVMSQFAENNSSLKPGAVRCWPHHFDIATYVQLEEGDFETAKGIGVGMSPGDESYNQPYFYINPWPHMDPASLPKAPLPGHWHTEGFVGAIATGDEVLTLADISDELSAFISASFNIGRDQLGA